MKEGTENAAYIKGESELGKLKSELGKLESELEVEK